MYVQSIHLMNNLYHVVLEKNSKRSQNIPEIPSHHHLILCSIKSMANSTYKHPKIKFVLQWIHDLKVELLECAYAHPFLTINIDKSNLDLKINNTALYMATHPKVLCPTLDPKFTYSTPTHNILVKAHTSLQIRK